MTHKLGTVPYLPRPPVSGDPIALHGFEHDLVNALHRNLADILVHLDMMDEDLAPFAAALPTDGNFLVGDGTTWVTESGATARTSLGAQTQDANLDQIAALSPADGNIIVGDGSAWVAESGAVARASLGAQAQDADLDAIAALAKTDGNFIVGDGSTWVPESGATARASMGLALSDTLVERSSDTTGNYTSDVAVAFNSEVRDAAGRHDNATFPSRITCVAGDEYVQLCANLQVSGQTTGEWMQVSIKKNGSALVGLPLMFFVPGGVIGVYNLSSAVMPVVAGDYFEVFLNIQSDTSVTVVGNNNTWFHLRRIPS